jgi:hypothetical protein
MQVEIIMLHEGQMERARRIAHGRQDSKAQSPNHRIDKKTSDYEMHFMGAQAEIAVCDRFHFPEDATFSPGGDDHRPDLYIGPLRIEVKAARYTPPIIKLNAATDFVSDVLLMCCIATPGVVGIWGFVQRAHFVENHYIQDFGYGPRACMKPPFADHASLDRYLANVKD